MLASLPLGLLHSDVDVGNRRFAGIVKGEGEDIRNPVVAEPPSVQLSNRWIRQEGDRKLSPPDAFPREGGPNGPFEERLGEGVAIRSAQDDRRFAQFPSSLPTPSVPASPPFCTGLDGEAAEGDSVRCRVAG